MKKEANMDSSAFAMLGDHPVHRVLFACFLGYHTRPRDDSNDIHELWLKKKLQGAQAKLLCESLLMLFCYCLMGSAKNHPLLFSNYGDQGKTLSCVHKIVSYNLALMIIAENHE